jgi:hypothetical protein
MNEWLATPGIKYFALNLSPGTDWQHLEKLIAKAK